MTVIVARYTDPLEAQIACGLLQAEGIAAHTGDAHTAIANWEWRLAIGGTKVIVDDADAERARAVIRRLDAGEFALSGDELAFDAGDGADDDANGDADDAATPRAEIDVADGHARALPDDRESPSSRVAWAALMLLAIPLPWRRRPRT